MLLKEKQLNLFKGIILEIQKHPSPIFSGLGLILYEELSSLPLSPLRLNNPEGINFPIKGLGNIVETLQKLNVKKSPFHDGFHLLSSKVELTHVCQYFSPPIQKNIILDYTKGGRFRAAQYGSCIENVLATGVVSEQYESFIFINGKSHKL